MILRLLGVHQSTVCSRYSDLAGHLMLVLVLDLARVLGLASASPTEARPRRLAQLKEEECAGPSQARRRPVRMNRSLVFF